MSLFHRVIVTALALTVAVTLFGVVAMLTKPNPIHHWFQRRAVHKLIGVALPDDTQDLHYAKFKISTFLAGYEAYIKFKTSLQSFLDLARRANFDLYETTGPNTYLPAPWRQAPEHPHLPWWDPTQETPPESASTTFGADGWIVAKYENGYAFMTISGDTGRTDEPEDILTKVRHSR